jgi:hypothetical protein
MSNEKRTTQLVNLEKRDAATVAAVVGAGAAVVSVGAAVYSAHQGVADRVVHAWGMSARRAIEELGRAGFYPLDLVR